MAATALMVLFMQRCDIYHRVVQSGVLGNQHRTYPAQPAIANQACLVRPGALGKTRGLGIEMFGEVLMSAAVLFAPGDVDIRMDDKIVVTLNAAGVVLSPGERDQNTYRVIRIADRAPWLGHQRVMLDTLGVLR